jgi:1,4-alpha-glucan branching enzyme
VPNAYGGREDLDAISFLRELNDVVHAHDPTVVMAAEESTAWPGVSRPTHLGGLGFGFKWNMGWMHDTLEYFSKEPVHRRFHHHELTFALVYAWNENFVLPLSHDEVVHGKRSLLGKLPGDRWQRFANLRALYALMWSHPGKKLLFMGSELAQEQEWSEERSLDWHLLEDPDHAGVQALVRDLNAAYRNEPALWEADFTPDGFMWLEPNAASENVLAFLRRSADDRSVVLCLANLSPVVRESWRVGLPVGGSWVEILNTDSRFYGGSDVGNGIGLRAESVPWNDQPFSAEVVLPPLAVVWLVPEKKRSASPAQVSTKRR